jgi:prephenate dehydrogenase
MALRRKGWRVTGVARDAAGARRALSRGAADEAVTRLADGVRGADAVVLAVPVADIAAVGRKAWPHLKPGALLTDVGSVKGPIVRALDGLTRGGRDAGGFVGAHPMCGSEKSGIENARPDLYRGAVCALTPTGKTPRAALEAARELWTAAGCRVLRFSPEEHDRRVAVVSHLPHLIAQALVLTAARDGRRSGDLAAGSFRDVTRVAGADPDLWADIFAMNHPAVKAAAGAFQAALSRLLKDGPSRAALARGKRAHAGLVPA